MSAATETAQQDAPATVARALRALELSGRRLVLTRGGRWGVLSDTDRRRMPPVMLGTETVQRLASEGVLAPGEAGTFVLAGASKVQEPSLRWVFVAASARRPGRRAGGVGFAGLAMLAREGRGPLSMRHVQAGLRLVADAERAAANPRVTMNWDSGPATRQRRAGGGGNGRTGDARLAALRLERLRDRMGENDWRLVWALCVDGEPMRTIRRRLATAQRQVHGFVAQALEALATAYDG